jgi:hypothetical protein
VGQSAYRIVAILQISIILLIYKEKSGFSKLMLLNLLKFLSGTFDTFCTPQPASLSRRTGSEYQAVLSVTVGGQGNFYSPLIFLWLPGSRGTGGVKSRWANTPEKQICEERSPKARREAYQ